MLCSDPFHKKRSVIIGRCSVMRPGDGSHWKLKARREIGLPASMLQRRAEHEPRENGGRWRLAPTTIARFTFIFQLHAIQLWHSLAGTAYPVTATSGLHEHRDAQSVARGERGARVTLQRQWDELA